MDNRVCFLGEIEIGSCGTGCMVEIVLWCPCHTLISRQSANRLIPRLWRLY